ncbi:MAG: hypothetical protein ORN83_15465, partial [Chthoniobacteraceae bacterium]|nr:hypothetical protein [Chthoniobacteraceae bacterium]
MTHSRLTLLPLLWATVLLAPASRAADETQRAASVKDPVSVAGTDLVFEKWNASLNVPDPVACSVDPKGRVYVASTARRKSSDLEIREHPMWIPDDVGIRSIEEKADFLRSA